MRKLPLLVVLAPFALATPADSAQQKPNENCHPSYPDYCIPPPPPDLDCKDIKGKKPFRVKAPDPHRFDRDKDGWACESRRR